MIPLHYILEAKLTYINLINSTTVPRQFISFSYWLLCKEGAASKPKVLVFFFFLNVLILSEIT